MAVQHILLGILSLTPSTGYELKKLFDAGDRIARPHITLSRIYPVLKSLVEKEFVVFEEITRTGGPDIKVYNVTPKGKLFFLEWLRKPINGDRYRFIHFLEKISFSPFLEKEKVLEMIDDELGFRRQQFEKSHETSLFPIEEYNHEAISHFEKFVQITTFLEDYGDANLQSYIHWLERTRRHIEEEW